MTASDIEQRFGVADEKTADRALTYRFETDVQGAPQETWTTTQIDTCVLFMRPPPRRCGVMTTSIEGLPGDEGAPGTLVLQFHDPLKDPDCGIQWTGVWQVSAGAR